jgi:small GTP-binding protein
MPINASHEYFSAEKEYLAAQTLDEKIEKLEALIRTAPKHKSSENLLAELKTRLKKFREKKEKAKSSGKSSRVSIKKEGFQFALVGKTNSGKSLLLSKLTNASPVVAPYPFTTRFPIIGTFNYEGIKAQIVDLPSIGSEFFDIGIVNTADCLLIVIESLQDLESVSPYLTKATSKKIITINKSDLLTSEQLRKLEQTIKSKKIQGIIISAETGYNLDALKELMISKMDSIRIYTKEPGKQKSNSPIVLPIGSSVKDVAESILKGFSKKVKETSLTGPSGKFPNQKVGLSHILKDLDIVEFHTIK